jgi:hypothetical protein
MTFTGAVLPQIHAEIRIHKVIFYLVIDDDLTCQYWHKQPVILKRLYRKGDNYLLIFCVFSEGRSSNKYLTKYKLGNFWEYFQKIKKKKKKKIHLGSLAP